MQIENDQQILRCVDIMASCNEGNFDGSDIPRLTKIFHTILSSGFLIKNIVPFIIENETEIKYFLLGKQTKTAIYLGVDKPQDRPVVIGKIIDSIRHKKLSDEQALAAAKSAIGSYLKPGIPDDEILELSYNLLEIEDALEGRCLLMNEEKAREIAAHVSKYLKMDDNTLNQANSMLETASKDILDHILESEYIKGVAKQTLRKLNYVEMQINAEPLEKLIEAVILETSAAQWVLWARNHNIAVDQNTIVDVIDAGISGMI